MAAIDPKKIEEHKAQLGKEKVHHLKAGTYEVLVRAPTRPHWKRFTQAAASAERRAEALETLVRDCLLEPSRQDFEAMLDDKPALGVVFGDEVADIAGAGLVAEKNA